MTAARIASISAKYRRPGHPAAFSAPQAVARELGVGASLAKKALEHVDSYVLHREYKRPRQFNPYFIYNRRDLVQADLIEMRDISARNDGVNYLLLLIDVFTRKIWMYALKRKTGGETRDALETWLNQLRVKPKVLQTDHGREFWNRQVQELLRRENVSLQLAAGTSKAAYAERANKTMQILIYKYLTDRETVRYIEVLQDLVSTYNKRGHRSLQYMSPNDADKPRNQRRVRDIAMQRFSKIKRKKPKYKNGELVRIKTDSKAIVSSRRAYAEQFHGEFFRITRINTTLPIPLYYLKSVDDGGMLDEGFYGEEIQRVAGNVFKIERVIRWRGRRGRNREALVRWKYFGPQHDSWVDETEITAV